MCVGFWLFFVFFVCFHVCFCMIWSYIIIFRPPEHRKHHLNPKWRDLISSHFMFAFRDISTYNEMYVHIISITYFRPLDLPLWGSLAPCLTSHCPQPLVPLRSPPPLSLQVLVSRYPTRCHTVWDTCLSPCGCSLRSGSLLPKPARYLWLVFCQPLSSFSQIFFPLLLPAFIASLSFRAFAFCSFLARFSSLFLGASLPSWTVSRTLLLAISDLWLFSCTVCFCMGFFFTSLLFQPEDLSLGFT